MRIDFRFLGRGVAVCAILAAAGILLNDVRVKAGSESVSGSRDRFRSQDVAALLGHFRGLAADLMWVKVYREWSRRDVNGLRGTLDLTVRLDPGTAGFWLNGARMLAYDVTAWRLDELETRDGASFSRVKQEQLREALGFLNRGRRRLPEAWELDVEAAVMRMNLTQDWAGALEILERLERRDGVPFYIGRIRAEILLKLDRRNEALSWLKKFESTLPGDDPSARKEVVRSRILELEHRD